MNDETREKLHSIYEQIPKIQCKGLCTDECTNIGFLKPEFDHLVQITGQEPKLNEQTERCNYLTSQGRCEVYDDRPWVCRAFGVDERMRCPHGCKAERIMNPIEGSILLKRIGDLLGSREVVFNATPQVLFQVLRKNGCPKHEARFLAKELSETKIMPW